MRVPPRAPITLGRALGLSLLLVSCSGSIDQGPTGPNSPGPQLPGEGDQPSGPGQTGAPLRCADAPPDVGPSVMRRLSNLELQLSLQELFALPSPPSVENVPADNDKEGFKTLAEVQSISAQHLRAYSDKARELADALLADTARRNTVVGCQPGAAGCVRAFVERFGRLAFRRTMSKAEVDTYTMRAESNALDATDQLRYVAQALLISPNFLYRIEVGDAPDALSKLTADELATKLSFALWGRGPSAQLLDDAAQGKLDSTAGVREVAWQMLGDARANYFYARFFRQWLGYDTLRAPVSRPSDWSDELMPQMQAETDAVLLQHAFGAGDFHEALRSNQTIVSPKLASFYGLPAPAADGTLTIPASHARAGAGIFGHAALLSLKSDGDKVALRGNWLRRTFFCSTLQIPPDVAAELGELLVGLSPVQVVQKRNTEAACKGCHALIDPIGVGLSRFDATGRFDSSVDIGKYGVAPKIPDLQSVPFDSLASLASALAGAPQLDECLGEKVFIYMSGRDPQSADRCALEESHDAFAEAADFRALLAGAVASPSFRLRRAAEPTDLGAMK